MHARRVSRAGPVQRGALLITGANPAPSLLAVRKAVLGMMAVHRMQDGGAAHASPGHRHQNPETAEMRKHLEEMKDEARKEEVQEVYAEGQQQQA